MRYFKIEYVSKKTKHPEGEKTVVIYEMGAHKKQAFSNADLQMENLETDNVSFFKLPVVTKELTLTEYEALTVELDDEPITTEQTTTDAIEPVKRAFNNDDESLGLSIDDLQFAITAIVLFGYSDTYKENELTEIVDFSEAGGTPEEMNQVEKLLNIVDPLMLQLFDKIDLTQLLKFIEKLDVCEMKDENLFDYAILLIGDFLGLEYQPDLEESEPEKITIPAPPAFNLADFAPPCTFDADLADLNNKLDALNVGESLTIDKISNRLYHACNAVSKSTLDLIERDPALLEWQKNCPEDESKKDALTFGTAFHTLVLEPENFNDDFLIMPELNLRTTEGKAEKLKLESDAADLNKLILTNDEFKKLELMRDSVLSHPTVNALLAGGVAERSIFYRESENVVIRIRCDWITELNGSHFIMDLKSTPDVDKFNKSVADYRYHVQDALYTYIYEKATGFKPIFCFCATGKAVSLGRYPTRLLILENEDKTAGLNAALENINTYEECLITGIWGGFETITRPGWAKRNDNELTGAK